MHSPLQQVFIVVLPMHFPRGIVQLSAPFFSSIDSTRALGREMNRDEETQMDMNLD